MHNNPLSLTFNSSTNQSILPKTPPRNKVSKRRLNGYNVTPKSKKIVYNDTEVNRTKIRKRHKNNNPIIPTEVFKKALYYHTNLSPIKLDRRIHSPSKRRDQQFIKEVQKKPGYIGLLKIVRGNMNKKKNNRKINFENGFTQRAKEHRNNAHKKEKKKLKQHKSAKWRNDCRKNKVTINYQVWKVIDSEYIEKLFILLQKNTKQEQLDLLKPQKSKNYITR